MKLRIEVSDGLMREAMRVGNYRTHKEAIEAGLQLLVQVRAQAGIGRLRSKVQWEGDLEELRRGRNIGLDDCSRSVDEITADLAGSVAGNRKPATKGRRRFARS